MENETRFPSTREAFVLVIGTLLLFMLISLAFAGGSQKSALLILEGALIIPVLIFVIIRRYPLKSVFRLYAVSLRLIFLSLLIGISYSAVSTQLGVWIQKIRPMAPEIVKSLQALMTIHTVLDGVILISGAVVLAAITEEMLFRGFFQSTMERTGRIRRAILVGAFVFAMLHFNPWWLMEIFLMGIILGVLSWRSGSIVPCIVVHMLSNGISLFIVNMEVAFGWIKFDASLPPAWLIAALLVLAGSLALFIKWTDVKAINSSPG